MDDRVGPAPRITPPSDDDLLNDPGKPKGGARPGAGRPRGRPPGRKATRRVTVYLAVATYELLVKSVPSNKVSSHINALVETWLGIV
jgi:hypothetical protein